jgi:hypothetical protein
MVTTTKLLQSWLTRQRATGPTLVAGARQTALAIIESAATIAPLQFIRPAFHA